MIIAHCDQLHLRFADLLAVPCHARAICSLLCIDLRLCSLKSKNTRQALQPLIEKFLHPFDFAIVVHSVHVVVRDASANCGGENLQTPGYTSDVKVKANSRVKVTAPITMAADAPNACQGKSFPLVFSGRATRR